MKTPLTMRVMSAIILAVFTWTDIALAGNVYQIQVPEEYGKVTARYKGADENPVILIQDAHTSVQAQKSISKIISHLAENHDIHNVNLEGASSPLHLDFYKKYPNKDARDLIATQMVENGIFSGAEHAAITSNAAVSLTGVENDQEYQDNLVVAQEILKKKEALSSLFVTLHNALEIQKDEVFSEELLNFDKTLMGYETNAFDGSASFTF